MASSPQGPPSEVPETPQSMVFLKVNRLDTGFTVCPHEGTPGPWETTVQSWSRGGLRYPSQSFPCCSGTPKLVLGEKVAVKPIPLWH